MRGKWKACQERGEMTFPRSENSRKERKKEERQKKEKEKREREREREYTYKKMHFLPSLELTPVFKGFLMPPRTKL